MLIFDNIIFSLQHSGGISVVWKELLTRILNEASLYSKINFYEYNNAQNYNFCRKEIELPSNKIKSDSERFLFIKRYLNPNIKVNENDLFHSSYYRTLKGCVNISTVHDFTYEHYVKGIRQNIHTWQKKQAILKSKKIICISNNTRDDLLRFIPEVDSSKIVVIYNGVNEGFYQLNTTQKIKGFPYDKGEYLLFVGDRKSTYKQFNLAIQAASITKKPLCIVGKPLTQEELTRLNSINYYLLTGVSTETLNILYNNAFCLLYPSLYEGFGIPVVEAQRAGCPVIAGNNSSISEIIGKDGIALDKLDIPNIHEAIQALENSKFRNNIISEGLKNSKRFSWDNTYEQTLNVYKSLM